MQTSVVGFVTLRAMGTFDVVENFTQDIAEIGWSVAAVAGASGTSVSPCAPRSGGNGCAPAWGSPTATATTMAATTTLVMTLAVIMKEAVQPRL